MYYAIKNVLGENLYITYFDFLGDISPIKGGGGSTLLQLKKK